MSDKDAEIGRLHELVKTLSDTHVNHVRRLSREHEQELKIYGNRNQSYRARIERLHEALECLIDLNDNHIPFGGEIYHDKIDRAWNKAREVLKGVDIAETENVKEDNIHYPTQEAYELACRAIEKHRDRAEIFEAENKELRKIIAMNNKDLIRNLRKLWPIGPGSRVVCDTMDEAADVIEELENILSKVNSFKIGENIFIENRGPDIWAIVKDGMVLNNQGVWEHEPIPSNRSDEFIARTRFPLSEAWEIVAKYSQKENK